MVPEEHSLKEMMGGPENLPMFLFDWQVFSPPPHLSLAVQLVKSLPAMQETWVPSLGQG